MLRLSIIEAAPSISRVLLEPLSSGWDSAGVHHGSPEALGCWQTQSAMPMTRTQGTLWEADVCLPRDEFPITSPHRPYPFPLAVAPRLGPLGASPCVCFAWYTCIPVAQSDALVTMPPPSWVP